MVLGILNILSLFNPGYQETQVDNLKAKGIFRPNGFIKLTQTLPIKTVKGLSEGFIIVTPDSISNIWPSTKIQVGKSWSSNIEVCDSKYSKKPVYEIVIGIPNINSLSGQNIELQLTTSLSYPKLISRGPGGGVSFLNKNYFSVQKIAIQLKSSPISDSSSRLYSILFEVQPYFKIATFLAFFLLGISLLYVLWDFLWKKWKKSRQTL